MLELKLTPEQAKRLHQLLEEYDSSSATRVSLHFSEDDALMEWDFTQEDTRIKIVIPD